MPNTSINTVDFKPKKKQCSTSHATPPTSAAEPKTKAKSNDKPLDGEGWDNVPHTDSFSSYMHHKNRKLRDQFTSEFSKSSSSASQTALFKGVVVWVNGHTTPSRLQIRRIMGQHGGRLETYYTNRVTHVVASNLATATRLRFTKNSSTAPRVKLVSPKWITDCLARKERLSESKYPVPFMDNPNQTSLTSFFSCDSSKPNSKTFQLPQSAETKKRGS